MNTLEIVALCAVLYGFVISMLPIIDALLGNPVYHAGFYDAYLFPGPPRDKYGLPSTDVFMNARAQLPSLWPWMLWSVSWYVLVFHQPSTQSAPFIFLVGMMMLMGLAYVGNLLLALEGLTVYVRMIACRPLRDSFLKKHPQRLIFVGDVADNVRRYHKFVLISVVGRSGSVQYVILGTLPYHANIVAEFLERYRVCHKYVAVQGGGSADWIEPTDTVDVRKLELALGGRSQAYGAADLSQVLAVLKVAFSTPVRLPNGSIAQVEVQTW